MRTRPYLWTALGTLTMLALAVTARSQTNPDALWHIVHDRCVPSARSGPPAPCLSIGPDDIVLKDINGRTQVLLIPTARITGIEDPALLAPPTANGPAPNYFADAWHARLDVDTLVGHPLPRDAIALAVNPPGNRSQNQLHIHVDCLRPDIRDAVPHLMIGPTWTMLPDPLQGQRYAAMRLDGTTLGQDPFRLLADNLPGARTTMADYTLVVIGTDTPGFILLAGRIGPDGPGHGEDLQDHTCALADQITREGPR